MFVAIGKCNNTIPLNGLTPPKKILLSKETTQLHSRLTQLNYIFSGQEFTSKRSIILCVYFTSELPLSVFLTSFCKVTSCVCFHSQSSSPDVNHWTNRRTHGFQQPFETARDSCCGVFGLVGTLCSVWYSSVCGIVAEPASPRGRQAASGVRVLECQ